MGEILFAALLTVIFGGLTFGILLDLWERRRLVHLFGFWAVAGLTVHVAILGWGAVL